MGRALLIVACGILLGLAITWLVSTQADLTGQQKVQPPSSDAPYGGARPVKEPTGAGR